MGRKELPYVSSLEENPHKEKHFLPGRLTERSLLPWRLDGLPNAGLRHDHMRSL